jgi:hypothetical protein
MNALGDALEQIGAIITPYMTQLAAAVREAALAFQALPESARTTIVAIRRAAGRARALSWSRSASWCRGSARWRAA